MFGEDGVDVESDVLVYFHFSFTMVWIGDADDSGLNLKASILRVVACGHVIIEDVAQLVVIECLGHEFSYLDGFPVNLDNNVLSLSGVGNFSFNEFDGFAFPVEVSVKPDA